MFETDPFSNFRCMLQFIFVVSDYQTSGNMSVHVTIMTYYQAETIKSKKRLWNEKVSLVHLKRPLHCIFSLFANQMAVTFYLFVCQLWDLQNMNAWSFYLTMVLTQTCKINHSPLGLHLKTRGTVCHVLAIFGPYFLTVFIKQMKPISWIVI